ncbi:MAG: hypothetical protein KKD39_07620 [Candidatus Altiarchaeota archaeon]|nr:hypothetical protein [Candidatus Altiarchaeota archaeon]
MGSKRKKIVVSAGYCGGIGGAERNLKAMIESMPEHEFHIMAKKVVNTGYFPGSGNFRLNETLDKDEEYDLYIYMRAGKPPYVGDRYNFRKKAIIQSGNPVFDLEKKFDYIIMQGIDGLKLCSRKDKCKIVVADPRTTWPEKLKKVEGLPKKFYLTVFNPYHPLKGAHILYMVAKYSKYPMIWCYNSSSELDYSNIGEIENVLQLHNLPQEKLYYIYSKATAYVSFSLSEGYGWAIADAIALNLPIVSRSIGVVTMLEDKSGVRIYNNERELKKIIENAEFTKAKYDKIFKQHTYKKLFKEILK